MEDLSQHRALSYGRQSIDEDDIRAVVEVLRGDWLTQGPRVQEFEAALAARLGAPYCSVTANGTASLHLIGLALGWRPGDIVITTPLTFLASTNCIVYSGATPDFVDIELSSYTIDPQQVEERIKWHRNRGKNVKAVIAVDFAGHPCDWKSLAEIAKQFDVQLVNDHCHAIGSTYNNDPYFAAKYADAVNLSFHPVKHVTTGEGGAIVTRHDWLDRTVKLLRNHGMTRDTELMERKEEGPWYYEMLDLGFNYRITDFQCALGIHQLSKLDAFLQKRKQIAARYDVSFHDDPRFIVPTVQGDSTHAYHLYPLRITFDNMSVSRKNLFEQLRKRGVNCQVHYIPIHWQPYYRKKFGFAVGDYPNVEKFYAEEISLPCFPSLSENESDLVINLLREFVK